MAQYSKVTKDGKVQYLEAGKEVDGKVVPVATRNALAATKDGTLVDELGDEVNPETDVDESEDENLDQTPPTPPETPDDEPEEEEAPLLPVFDEGAPQDEAGFGFKRAHGKTLSIFSNKPHETVKNINGIMVPMTVEEYNTKSDGDILAKLKTLKKL